MSGWGSRSGSSRTEERVYLASTGARTPLGFSAPTTAAAVRAGIAARADHPFMVDKNGEPMVVCADGELSSDLHGLERLLVIALPAAHEALQPLSKVRKHPPVSIFLGLPEKRPGLTEDLEAVFPDKIRSALSEIAGISDVVVHSLGNASGFFCLELALAAIAHGRTDLCLVGGVDSYMEPETLEWLDENERLHSESTIWGLCPGEGAGFCLLASASLVHALGLPTSVGLTASASAMEANCINTETVCLGEGLSEAFKLALSSLPAGTCVNHTICDMNGDPYRGNEYGFAMLRCNRWFGDEASFSTPASCWGDVGAASGPLFLTLAAAAYDKNYSPGPNTFLWTSSDGGLRSAAVLQGPQGKNFT